MVETLKLYRSGEVQPPSIKMFDISEVSRAYRYFAGKDRVGKVVISMETPYARVVVSQIQCEQYSMCI